MMIVFFLTGHFFPQHLSLTSICNVCAHSSLQYFPTFPQFLACLAGHVVLTRGCNHIRHLTSSLNVGDEVCSPPPPTRCWFGSFSFTQQHFPQNCSNSTFLKSHWLCSVQALHRWKYLTDHVIMHSAVPKKPNWDVIFSTNVGAEYNLL